MNLDFSKIKDLPDYQERVSLAKSWAGQVDKCKRKQNLQDPYYGALALAWEEKIAKILSGVPLSECKGKVKVKGQKPMTKKQRIAWKQENKAEIREFRKKVQKTNEEKQRKGDKNV